MLERALVLALTLTSGGGWSSPVAAAAPFMPGQSAWQRTESQHFEIHYLPALAPELERVTRSAERAYDRISGRLDFTLATRVPLVMFAPSGALTRRALKWPLPCPNQTTSAPGPGWYQTTSRAPSPLKSPASGR